MANILVFIETDEDVPTAASLGALTEGRRIASRLGATLHAILPCEAPPTYGADDLIAVLSAHGADKVVLTTNCPQCPPSFATHGPAVVAVCERFPPLLVIFPVPAGYELGPRTAFHLGALHCPDARLVDPMGTESFELSVFRRRFRWREPIQSHRPLVLTVRDVSLSDEQIGDDEAEVVVVHSPTEGPQGIVPVLRPTADPSAMRVVVGGGAGLGDAAGFERLREFADAIGAELVATLTACERGIADRALLAGLDGLPIDGDLYLAFGVSGSDHHLAALAAHCEVIAVNIDPDAPIFRVARFGLVADAAAALSALTEAARQNAGDLDRAEEDDRCA